MANRILDAYMPKSDHFSLTISPSPLPRPVGERERVRGLYQVVRAVAFSALITSFFINLSCGKQKDSDFRSEIRTNTPPSIISVNVLPKNPNQESDLELIIQSQDPDRDPLTYRYQWFRNHEEISGEDKNILKSGNFRKGDLIQVQVTPSDGKVEGESLRSEPVEILNSQPMIQEVRIEPQMAFANDSLRVQVKSLDRDEDSIDYLYQWEKNGEVLSEERGEILESGRFKKGDVVTITVTPDDKESQGPSKRSEPVTILNSPPIIVSTPPTSVEGNDYRYQVKAYDPDNDPVSFNLKSGPKGMEIEKETGLIRWVIQSKDKGTYSVEIEAYDQEGVKSFQRFVLNVDIK
jgi:hypothetical protein